MTPQSAKNLPETTKHWNTLQRTIWYYIPENSICHSYCCGNLKSHKISVSNMNIPNISILSSFSCIYGIWAFSSSQKHLLITLLRFEFLVLVLYFSIYFYLCRFNYIKTNQELDEIIKRTNIINFIRAQRLSWLGHIERMQGTRMVKAIYSWKPISRRPIGRPKTRWGG